MCDKVTCHLKSGLGEEMRKRKLILHILLFKSSFKNSISYKVHGLFHFKKLTAFKITKFPERQTRGSKSDQKPFRTISFQTKWKLKDCINGISPKPQHDSQEKMFIFYVAIAPHSPGGGDVPSCLRSLHLAASADAEWEFVHYMFWGRICSFSGGLGTAGLSGLWGESFRTKTGNMKRVSSMVCSAIWLRSAKPCSFHIKENLSKNVQVWSTGWRPKRTMYSLWLKRFWKPMTAGGHYHWWVVWSSTLTQTSQGLRSWLMTTS